MYGQGSPSGISGMGTISGVNRGASSYFNKNAPPGGSSHGIGSSGMGKPGGPSAYGG